MRRDLKRRFVDVLRNEADDPEPRVTGFRQLWGADYMEAYIAALVQWRIRDRLRTIHRLGGV
jgi:hypothetical protein